MSKIKLYTSEGWLRREYLIKKKPITQIAKEQKTSPQTIQNYLEKFGLIKNQRRWAGRK